MVDLSLVTGGFKMGVASNTEDNLGAQRRQFKIKKPVTKIIAISLLLVLITVQPILSLVPAAFEDFWFPNGTGYFHDMQYGFGRVWTNQLIGQGRVVSINPDDMSDYSTLNITEGGIYSIAIDEVHNVVWGTMGGLYKIYANNSGYEFYSFPESASGGGVEVIWDGEYCWIGLAGSSAPAVLRFNPETETWLVPNLIGTNEKPVIHVRDLVYDYVHNCIWAFSWAQVVKIDRETGNQLGVWSVPIYGDEIFSAVFNGEYLFAGNGPNPKPAEVVRINPANPEEQVIWRLSDYFSFGELYWIHTLITDADGIVYAGLYRSGFVILIDPDTGPFEYVGVGRWHLHGLAFDENGWLWGCFNENPGKVYRFYLGGSAPPPPPPPKEAEVSGYVTYANGTAVPNALVEIGDYSTLTDVNGFYNITVPLSDYEVKVTIQESFTEEKPYALNVTFAGD
jgi:hypothetical protein